MLEAGLRMKKMCCRCVWTIHISVGTRSTGFSFSLSDASGSLRDVNISMVLLNWRCHCSPHPASLLVARPASHRIRYYVAFCNVSAQK